MQVQEKQRNEDIANLKKLHLLKSSPENYKILKQNV